MSTESLKGIKIPQFFEEQLPSGEGSCKCKQEKNTKDTHFPAVRLVHNFIPRKLPVENVDVR